MINHSSSSSGEAPLVPTDRSFNWNEIMNRISKPPQGAAPAPRAPGGSPPEREAAPRLSDREEQVLDLAAQGLTDRQMANEMFVSAETVGSYWKRVFQKLEVSTRAEAVAVHGKRQSARARKQRDEARAIAASLAREMEAKDRKHAELVQGLREVQATLARLLPQESELNGLDHQAGVKNAPPEVDGTEKKA